MKQLLLSLLLICVAFISKAQTTEDSIKVTISKLFDGMRNADATLLKSAFADSAILQSIGRNKEGKTVIDNETLNEFADFVSKQTKGAADERITYDAIKIDGPLAMVWAPYKFFFNGKFSHCGVDAFQLVRINGEWKIQYLIDTRRRTGCE
jgi:Putative lumazine-binding